MPPYQPENLDSGNVQKPENTKVLNGKRNRPTFIESCKKTFFFDSSCPPDCTAEIECHHLFDDSTSLSYVGPYSLFRRQWQP